MPPKAKQSKKQSKSAKKSDPLQAIRDVFSPILPKLKPARKPPKPVVIRKSTRISLSKCALLYALAIADPFDSRVDGVCNPSIEQASSDKEKAEFSIDVAIGTALVGYILFTPSVASDSVFCYYTTSAYTGTLATPLSANNTLNTGWARATLPNKFSIAQLQGNSAGEAGVAGAMVVAGARATYTGTTMNESGLVYCFHDPQHQSVSGMGISDITSQAAHEVRPATRKPCTLSMFPVSPLEAEFYSGLNNVQTYYPFSEGTTFSTTYKGGTGFTDAVATVSVGFPCAIMAFTGTAANTFHVEMIERVEYVGQLASNAYTPHHCDTEGGAQVNAAATEALRAKRSNPDKSMWAIMYDNLQRVAAGVTRVAVSVAVERAFLAALL